MADTTLTASVIAKAALAILDNELDVLGTFYRAPESEFDKSVNGYTIGDTVSIRRPADFTVRNTITASAQDVIEGKTTLTIDQVRGVDFDFTSTDLTLKDTSVLINIVLTAAMKNSDSGLPLDPDYTFSVAFKCTVTSLLITSAIPNTSYALG